MPMELGTARDLTRAYPMLKMKFWTGLAREIVPRHQWRRNRRTKLRKWGPQLRNLYELFRDGVIDDAILSPQGGRVSPWKFLPEEPARSGEAARKPHAHIGRVATMALIRRFMQRAATEFPGGIMLNSTGFSVEESFVEFVKTHKAMGSTHDDMVKAWEAMQAITT